MDPIVAPYGSWRSPISAEMAASAATVPVIVRIDRGAIYYLERRPNERGRSVIVRCSPDGTLRDVTPPGYDVRTRVHEYGGGDFIVVDDVAYFANGPDQRVYRQPVNGAPEAITREATGMRYADFCLDRKRQRLVCVREDHTGLDVINTLVAIDLGRGGAEEVLAQGYDFYATPRLDPQGERLAWLSWRHPNMPWDGTELWVAELTSDGQLVNARQVAGGPQESIFQPDWSPQGALHFVSDATGWWNLYRLAESGAEALCPMAAEFGQPQWGFDHPLYGFLTEDRILCTFIEKGVAQLATLDPTRRVLSPIVTHLTDIAELRVTPEFAALIGGSPTTTWSVLRVDHGPAGELTLRAVKGVEQGMLDERYISTPEKIEFPTEHGLTAFAYFYPPTNPLHRAPADDRPPLLVMCHGGPTASTSAVLSLARQYWTSRGFALLDVDYGGSTGYGRAYRERLKGQWGVVDMEDCVNAARYLVERGRVDPQRLAIRGGSAGGYTTLCALTFTDVFRAGASRYGIGDLEALAKDTHKFESHYADTLIAPYPEGKAIYEARSPIHFTDRLSCALIFFQGLEDPVVPPAQSEMMFEAVRKKGLPVAYLAFEGEQHGFRQAKNVIRSLEAELYFYGKVFSFEPADEIEPVEIENLTGQRSRTL